MRLLLSSTPGMHLQAHRQYFFRLPKVRSATPRAYAVLILEHGVVEEQFARVRSDSGATRANWTPRLDAIHAELGVCIGNALAQSAARWLHPAP
jgi:hypothetical protein